MGEGVHGGGGGGVRLGLASRIWLAGLAWVRVGLGESSDGLCSCLPAGMRGSRDTPIDGVAGCSSAAVECLNNGFIELITVSDVWLYFDSRDRNLCLHVS